VDNVGRAYAGSVAPKRHQAIDFDTLSTATEPLKSSENAGKYDVFCVDIVEVTDSSSVPPTNENTEKTNKATERIMVPGTKNGTSNYRICLSR
jgi:hypothetical protein